MTTDAELIARSRDDPPAFGELFSRHARLVHGYAARRAGAEAADEVLAETFLIAFERRERFDLEVLDARPWLLGIATRRLGAHRRREARHLQALSRQAEPDEHDGGMGRATDRTDAERLLRRLAGQVRALPARDRDVLLLHAWTDLSTDQIAAALDVPAATVRSRLARARRRLRISADTTLLEEADNGRPDTAATA